VYVATLQDFFRTFLLGLAFGEDVFNVLGFVGGRVCVFSVDAISLDKRDKDEEQAMGLLSEGSKPHATSPGGSVFGHLSIEQRQQLNEANNNAKQVDSFVFLPP
jgi:hypothetical protein